MTDMTCAEFAEMTVERAQRQAVATRVKCLLREAAQLSTAPAYIPQEYPKMVPGPNGPTTVQDEAEEVAVISARINALRNNTAALIEMAPVPIDVAAWIAARNAPQHDWIAALHRPYVPVV